MAKKTAAVATAEGTGAPAEKKYMKPSEVVTFGIGLFGVALLTGWMPDYTTTFFADFAFKGKGFDSNQLSTIVSSVFGVAGFIGAICELIIGMLVDRTRTPLGKVKPWVGFGAIPLAIVAMLVFVAPDTSSLSTATIWMFVIYSLYTAVSSYQVGGNSPSSGWVSTLPVPASTMQREYCIPPSSVDSSPR